MRKRVLLAGLFHETHTFVEELTGLDRFTVRRGGQILATADDGSPLSGVLEVSQQADWQVVPVVDMRATPGGTVTDEVVELFSQDLLDAAESALKEDLDGVFLVLHGAMASQSIPDVEGEILERLAQVIGPNLPVFGVFDLHANFSERMAKYTDALVAYRHNPHTDARQAAVDAARLMDQTLRSGKRPQMVFEPTNIIWPPTGTGTADDPMKTLESMAREIERSQPEILAVNVVGGFSFADTYDTGVSFSAATLGKPEAAQQQLRRLHDYAKQNRQVGNVVPPPIEDVMPKLAEHPSGPIILVEPADNIGGGGPGDCTGILQRLLEHQVENAAVVIADPQAVEEATAIGVGNTGPLSIGGKSGPLSGGPVELEVELLSTSNGQFRLEDLNSHLASMWGADIDMGPCAVVRHAGIQILLTTRKTPPFDLGQLRSQGIEPEKLYVIGVKAAVAHRRAYDPITAVTYTVDTPGPCTSNLKKLPFRLVRRPVFPLDDID